MKLIQPMLLQRPGIRELRAYTMEGMKDGIPLTEAKCGSREEPAEGGNDEDGQHRPHQARFA